MGEVQGETAATEDRQNPLHVGHLRRPAQVGLPVGAAGYQVDLADDDVDDPVEDVVLVLDVVVGGSRVDIVVNDPSLGQGPH